MNKTFYVTTPIYYPSGKLHIGHVYTTTLAYTLANFKKLDGYDVKFLTGADEHGQKIELKAKENNISPKEYVDKVSDSFKDLWNKLEIYPDYFSRTTNKNHEEAVKKQFTKLLNQGIIYKGKYTGLYSVQDEEFLTETQAEKKEGEWFHPISGHKLEIVNEESYFLKISEFEDWIRDFLQNSDIVIPKKIINELINNFINKGLQDLSVTRTSFSWGIPISEEKTHVIYVWLDALNNYITALGYNSKDESDFNKYWVNGDEIVHIVGKEITRFHCIYWPIILKANEIRRPTKILSHGWIVTPEGKMSKSKGNVIDPNELIDEFGAEVLKYFFACHTNIHEDSTFDKEILKNAYNADLANNYGNLVSRTLAMTKQNFDTPLKYKKSILEVDKKIEQDIINALNLYKEKFNNYKINKALQAAINLSKKLNKYIDVTMPWTLKDDKKRLEQLLLRLLNGIYAITTMLSVVMPKKTEEVADLIGLKELSFQKAKDFNKFDQVAIKESKVIFSRIK